jgi:hypothetical protein
VSTDWNNLGTQTAPTRYYTMGYFGSYTEVVGRFFSNGAANFEQAGLIIFNTANLNEYAKCGVGYSAATGNIVVGSRVDGGGLIDAVITGAQRDAGVWVKMSLVANQVFIYYNTVASATPPLTWTFLNSSPVNFLSKTLGIGQFWQTVNVAGTLAGGCKYWEWATLPVGYSVVPSFQATL